MMSALIECCQECIRRDVDQRKCYRGRPYFECPSYEKYDKANGIITKGA